MEKYFDILQKVELFQGIENLIAMLTCLDGNIVCFKKNQIIFYEDQTVTNVGIVLEGEVHIIKEDYTGNKNIIVKAVKGQLFGEAFVCAGIKKSPVSVISNKDSHILFIDYNRIITTCTSACHFHSKLIDNMVKILAYKNIMLNQKIELLSLRTIRERIMFFLTCLNAERNCPINIEFSREELADYLCANRSALCKELSKMQNEGLILYNKNTFTIL